MAAGSHAVLLVGANPRVGVAVARSLHAHGIRVFAGRLAPDQHRFASRSISGFVSLPPMTEYDEFLTTLTKVIDRHSIDMLMPCSDAGLQAIAENYDALRPLVRTGCPQPDSVARVLDKAATLRAAERVGMLTPRTFDVPDMGTLDRMRADFHFPLVAKPRDRGSRREFAAMYFHSVDSLKAEFARDPEFGSRNLIQEFCQGRGVGIAALMREGRSVAMFQHTRLKESPSTGGVSVLAESSPLDPTLAAATASLLRELDWDGVAMVEFRRGADGRAFLMEVNGRYWGSLALAIRAGVDFPYYHWQVAHGLECQVPRHYDVGIRVRWPADDVRRLAEVLFKKLPDGSQPDRIGEIVRFFTDYNHKTHSGLGSWVDPAPAVADSFELVRDVLWGISKRVARRIAPAAYERAAGLRSIGYAATAEHGRRQLARAFGREPRFRPADSTNTILFVCNGNIMRSPLAAALLRRALNDGVGAATRIQSAGLHAVPGRRAEPLACSIAGELGISLGEHRAQSVSSELVAGANAIFVMDRFNEAELLARYPDTAGKVFLLAMCDGEHNGRLDITDPYGHPPETVRECFARISASVACLARQLSQARSA
jgi:protein-tyrosine-phosphatase/predicted ATP-grasp superfamily ATP-dependent carboligase